MDFTHSAGRSVLFFSIQSVFTAPSHSPLYSLEGNEVEIVCSTANNQGSALAQEGAQPTSGLSPSTGGAQPKLGLSPSTGDVSYTHVTLPPIGSG